MTKKLILDLDTGIDDALALAYAIASPEVDLIGVICSYGNVVVAQAVTNTQRLLALLGQPNVPVYAGATHASTQSDFQVLPVSQQIHGVNGIGDVALPDVVAATPQQSAVDFLIAATQQYGADLVLVPTGPLTNLAAAIKRYPSLVDQIGQITLMGGALTVPGNVSATAEANIAQDPEAAKTVFTSGAPIAMVGLDVTLRTLLTTQETARWRTLKTASSTAFADMVDFYIKAYEVTSPDLGGCALHDPLAVGLAIDPSLAQWLALDLTVDTTGATCGRTIGDLHRLTAVPRTQVAVQVAATTYLRRFMQRLSCLFAQN